MLGSVQEPLGCGQDSFSGRPHILRHRPCFAGAEQPPAGAHSGASAHRKARRGQDDPLFVCSSQRGHRTDTAGGHWAVSERAVEAQPTFSDVGLSWAGADQDLHTAANRDAVLVQHMDDGLSRRGLLAYSQPSYRPPLQLKCSTRHCISYGGTSK